MEITDWLFTAEKKLSYLQGKLDGIYEYAWMKDGVYYVGTGTYTYRQAAEEINAEIQAIKTAIKQHAEEKK